MTLAPSTIAWLIAARKPAVEFGPKYTRTSAPGARAAMISTSSMTSPSAPLGPSDIGVAPITGTTVAVDAGHHQAGEVDVQVLLRECPTELDDPDGLPMTVPGRELVGLRHLQRGQGCAAAGARRDRVPGRAMLRSSSPRTAVTSPAISSGT